MESNSNRPPMTRLTEADVRAMLRALSPIHHAMARAMPVSGGCPVRVGDRLAFPGGDETGRVSAVWWDAKHREWRVVTPAQGWDWHLRWTKRVFPAPRVPPRGGFGMIASRE